MPEANLTNFDAGAERLVFTPNSTEALELLGMSPDELRKKTKEDFQKENPDLDDAAIAIIMKRAEKKRLQKVNDAKKARLQVIKDNRDEEANLRKEAEAEARRRKLAKEQMRKYERQHQALENQVEATLYHQAKVQEKKEKTEQALMEKEARLEKEKKMEANRIKAQKRDEAKLLAERQKADRAKAQAERLRKEKELLDNLQKVQEEELDKRKTVNDITKKRFDEGRQQKEREHHYNIEMKKIKNLKREKRVKEEEEAKRKQRELDLLNKRLAEEEARERIERRRREREYKEKMKLKKMQKQAARVQRNLELDEQIRQEAIANAQGLNEKITNERQEFEERCRQVRQLGIKEIQAQVRILNAFKAKSGGVFRASKSNPNSPTNGGLLPPMAGSNNLAA